MKLTGTILSFLLFVILITTPAVAVNYLHPAWLVPKFWVMFFFITALTFITVLFIVIVSRIKKDLYAQTFLAATTGKILFSMFFVLIFLTKTTVNRYVFVADFVYIYFLNMGFEIYCLLRNLRNQNLQ
ncbi:MAG TPA: hypothetical protein VIM77_13075 [Mucilaginibacter sp.]